MRIMNLISYGHKSSGTFSFIIQERKKERKKKLMPFLFVGNLSIEIQYFRPFMY